MRPRLPFRSRARRDEELNEELRAHLRMAEADRVARGESPADAAANARREFGNVGLVKEVTRETWGGVWLERLIQDAGFGFRMLRRSPGFSLLALLCLTLGIGANAAVYSWIEGILLRPYPAVTRQDRLLVLAGTARGESDFDDVSWPDMVDFQKSCTLVESFIADKIIGTTLSIGDRAERIVGSLVSANYFDALGIRPVLGRGFEPGEDAGRNAHPVVVIGYRLWKDRFRGDPGIIGRTQLFNGFPHTIVGVAPEAFHGTFVNYAMQFWVPASMQEVFDPSGAGSGYGLEDRGARWIEGFVRLKPGVTREQAQEQISAAARRLEAAYPGTNRGRGIRLIPLWRSPFNGAGELMPVLRIVLAVVFFVLLIACANVSNLLLVRSFARKHEMTLRLALGAGRGRLVRQLLTEALVLSALAAAGGLLVAYLCRNVLVLFFPPRGGIPLDLPAALDGRVLGLSAAVCLVSTVLFALVPAFQASRIRLAVALKSGSGGVVEGGRRARVRSSLVLIQVALSFVLLVGAGLLVRSLQGLRAADPGFSTRVLTTGVGLKSAGYSLSRQRNFLDELMDRVRAIGGVESAAYGRTRPFGYYPFASAPIVVEGYLPAPDERPAAEYDEVSPGYLATLGIPLVSGREFTLADDENAPPVAVVNDAMAARYWSGRDPVGRRLQLKGRWLQVIGVARASKYQTLLEPPRPFLYVPLRQDFRGTVSLFLRTSRAPSAVAAALAHEIHKLDPNLAPSEVITMREQVDRSTSTQRVAVTLLGVFGGIALLLAAIGLYGVMSYAVSQSKRELGLRMALGANASDLVRLVMSHGLALTAGGVVLGAAAALALTRLIGSLLYKVSPLDPSAFGSALTVMTIASLAACFLPTWRAVRTDPVRALKD
ncbi:MAG: ADOP family duplicated permease [Acidobacteriota bacterium]